METEDKIRIYYHIDLLLYELLYRRFESDTTQELYFRSRMTRDRFRIIQIVENYLDLGNLYEIF